MKQIPPPRPSAQQARTGDLAQRWVEDPAAWGDSSTRKASQGATRVAGSVDIERPSDA